MYKTSGIKPDSLPSIPIEKQELIKEVTGEKLDLEVARQLIELNSKGFTEPNEKAQKADQLLTDLLAKTQAPAKAPKETQQEATARIRIQKEAKTRKLKLIKLKLKIAA